jgi:hypothetical protein
MTPRISRSLNRFPRHPSFFTALIAVSSAHAEGSASRGEQSALDLYSGLRGLQLGANAKPGRRSSGGLSRGRRVSLTASS